MTVATSHVAPARNWRRVGLRAMLWIVTVLSLTVMGGIPGILAPWTLLGNWPGHAYPEMHRWHDAQWGAMFGLLIGGALIMLLRGGKERPLLVQFLVFATATIVVLNAPFDPLILAGLVLGMLAPMLGIAALYPHRDRLLQLGTRDGQTLNWPLVVVSLLTAAALARPAWHWYSVQRMGYADEHSQFQHWTITAVLAVVLVGAGLLAATRRSGSRDLGVIAGVALVYLGIAAMAVPNHDGSWGTTGGAFAILAGVGYIFTTLQIMPRLRIGRVSQREADATGHSG